VLKYIEINYFSVLCNSFSVRFTINYINKSSAHKPIFNYNISIRNRVNSGLCVDDLYFICRFNSQKTITTYNAS